MVAPAWCEPFTGYKYADKGRGPSAYDCWGFVLLIESMIFGVDDLPDLSDQYDSSENHAGVAQVVARYKQALAEKWVPVSEPMAGDIIMLKIAGEPWHCGVCAGDDWMIHIQKGVNVALERFSNWTWRNRIEGFYRHA